MMPFSQHDATGRLRHLTTLDGLSADEVHQFLERAQRFVRATGAAPARSHTLDGVTVAHLFTEPSTRTRASFELATARLGGTSINLDISLSSRQKGETVLDTIYTLQAMAVDVFVIRDREPGVCQYVAEHVQDHVSIVSAGEAHLSHPTQGLLDALTIWQFKGGFRDLVVSIVGDIRHSRVARSTYLALSKLGVGEIRLVAPAELMPDPDEMHQAKRLHDIDAGIAHADVIIMLRIQKERMQSLAIPSDDAYFAQWGLNQQRLKLARPEVIVMHPGPMNRGVEIASDVADGKHSVIRNQVSNGVAIRMAVLETLIENRLDRGSRP